MMLPEEAPSKVVVTGAFNRALAQWLRQARDTLGTMSGPPADHLPNAGGPAVEPVNWHALWAGLPDPVSVGTSAQRIVDTARLGALATAAAEVAAARSRRAGPRPPPPSALRATGAGAPAPAVATLTATPAIATSAPAPVVLGGAPVNGSRHRERRTHLDRFEADGAGLCVRGPFRGQKAELVKLLCAGSDDGDPCAYFAFGIGHDRDGGCRFSHKTLAEIALSDPAAAALI